MTAILLHLYYQDLWPEFKEKILPLLNDSVHLYVSVNSSETDFIADIRQHANQVYVVENRGLDFGPFIYVYKQLRHLNYRYFVKLHGKKSLHTPGIGDYWRKTLTNAMIDSEEQFKHVIAFMEQTPDVYMASSLEFYHDVNREPINHPNRLAALPYINKVCSILNVDSHGSFFAGSMFIVSAAYLDKLFKGVDLENLYNQFEYGYSMDSFAHGMERVIGYGVATHKGLYLTI